MESMNRRKPSFLNNNNINIINYNLNISNYNNINNNLSNLNKKQKKQQLHDGVDEPQETVLPKQQQQL